MAYTFENNFEVLIHSRGRTVELNILQKFAWPMEQLEIQADPIGDVSKYMHPYLGSNCQMNAISFKGGTSSINYN